MTYKDILGMDIDAMEKLTDKEALEIFAPILKYTRPELVEKKVNVRRKPQDTMLDAKKALAMKMAQSLGIELNL